MGLHYKPCSLFCINVYGANKWESEFRYFLAPTSFIVFIFYLLNSFTLYRSSKIGQPYCRFEGPMLFISIPFCYYASQQSFDCIKRASSLHHSWRKIRYWTDLRCSAYQVVSVSIKPLQIRELRDVSSASYTGIGNSGCINQLCGSTSGNFFLKLTYHNAITNLQTSSFRLHLHWNYTRLRPSGSQWRLWPLQEALYPCQASLSCLQILKGQAF